VIYGFCFKLMLKSFCEGYEKFLISGRVIFFATKKWLFRQKNKMKHFENIMIRKESAPEKFSIYFTSRFTNRFSTVINRANDYINFNSPISSYMKSFKKYIVPGVAFTAISLWQKRKFLLFSIFVLSFWSPAFSQEKPGVTVSGVVTDSSGAGLEKTTVLERGTKNATATDADGRFTIKVAGPNAVLVISSVGYDAKQVKVGNQTNLTVSIDRQKKDLDEVIVVGYGSKKKESITGAVSSITAKDLDRVHGGSTVSSGLAGKLPGVTFKMPDGRPGASANIQIRNMGNPLYVIDGIQQDAGQFNNLAPNDVESITILKDAAAAIYGVRAANGVVVVTTKQGKKNSANTININAYTGAQNWSRFTEVLTNSYDYQRFRAEAEVNRYGSTAITASELEKWKAGTEPGYDKSFNWKDFIIKKNAPLNSANINFTGGTDKLNYYVSGTRLFQNSVLGREYKFGRTNLQSNINAQIANGLKIGLAINGRVETRDNPGVPGGDDYWLARFAILRNTPLERPYANDNPEYLNDIKHNETNWAYLNYKNAGRFKNEWRVLQTNATLEYDVPFVKGLSLKGLYSYYIADNLFNNHEYTYDTYTYTPATDKYDRTGGSINPWREREQIKQINVSTQGQVNYNKKFGKSTVNALFVAERIKNQRLRNWIHSVPTTNVLPLIYFATADQYNDSDDRQARIGYIGRLNYNYDNKYFVELSGRRDASYLFTPENRVGYFPSVSAGWRITQEDFVQKLIGNSNILNELKLRGSYGQLGDDGDALGLGAFSYTSGYNYNTGISILNGVPVINSTDRGAPTTNISWLISKITDIGADFTLFNGKITGTFDYFYRERSGLRASKTNVLIPSELGYGLPNENLNKDAQYGTEGSLSYNGKVGDIQFQVGGNLSYTRSKYISRYNPTFFNSWDQYRNSDIGRFTRIDWGYTVSGRFQTQEEINNYKVNIDGQGNRTLLPGDLIYQDFNNDGKIDGYDVRPIGYGGGAQPNINFGFNLALNYKGIEFHADFSGAAGYTWFQNWETRWAFQNDGNLNTMFEDRWHRADSYDRNSAWIPGNYPALRYNESGHSNYNKSSTYWAHNVTYLRARTIELAYNLPASIMNKIKVVKKARFYVNGYNLFSIDNVKKIQYRSGSE
jgi:TonB-linked SusC/RagA family outer membrane protein